MLILWIFILVFMVFRWRILSPSIGILNMYLFDAAMWTVWAAYSISQPGPLPWLAYACGGLYIFWAILAVRNYARLNKIIDAAAEENAKKGNYDL